MPQLPRRLRPEQLIPFVLAATVFAFACGSSGVAGVQHVGRPLRWVLLFLLLALAAAVVLRERAPVRLPVSVIGAAATLGLIALVSTAWSVDPRLTFERAATLAVMLATVAALAQSSLDRAGGTERVAFGIVGGAAAVAVAGILVFVLRHADAVQPATRDLPERYQGLGQNPNTVSLLLASCLALVAWLFARAVSRRGRVTLAVVGLLFLGSMIGSGSRGSLIGGFAGVAVVVAFVPARVRMRAALGAATVAALAASIGLALVPKSEGADWKPPHVTATPSPGSHPKPGFINVEGAFPLDSDIGTILVDSKPTRRTLFGLTGRGEAWRGAIDLADERPVVGYGFGTEARVFVDRWADFVGGLPENSYIGMYLQLGVVGLLALLALAASIVVAALRRRDRWQVAGPLGALTAGLVMAFVQSYIYSVGDIATVALWAAAFLAAVRPSQEPARA
jgi:O-antigen ligase